MKHYINDFCDDLNYQPVILFLEDLTDSEIEKLGKIVCESVSHGYRWEYILKGNHCFYVENCDLQDCNGVELPQLLVSTYVKYKVYTLQYDNEKKQFYYEGE